MIIVPVYVFLREIALLVLIPKLPVVVLLLLL
jgi:hypothetical protein